MCFKRLDLFKTNYSSLTGICIKKNMLTASYLFQIAASNHLIFVSRIKAASFVWWILQAVFSPQEGTVRLHA